MKDATRIRKELITQGWTLIDTTEFLKRIPEFEEDQQPLYIGGKPAKQVSFESDGQLIESIIGGGNKKSVKRSKRVISSNRCYIQRNGKGKLQAFKDFLDELPALIPEERFYLAGLEARTMDASQPGAFQHWHKDGAYFRCITPIYGQATEYLASPRHKKPLSIPLKWTLVYTGQDRSIRKSTLHRTPQFTEPRQLLVGTYDPLWKSI